MWFDNSSLPRLLMPLFSGHGMNGTFEGLYFNAIVFSRPSRRLLFNGFVSRGNFSLRRIKITFYIINLDPSAHDCSRPTTLRYWRQLFPHYIRRPVNALLRESSNTKHDVFHLPKYEILSKYLCLPVFVLFCIESCTVELSRMTKRIENQI